MPIQKYILHVSRPVYTDCPNCEFCHVHLVKELHLFLVDPYIVVQADFYGKVLGHVITLTRGTRIVDKRAGSFIGSQSFS